MTKSEAWSLCVDDARPAGGDDIGYHHPIRGNAAPFETSMLPEFRPVDNDSLYPQNSLRIARLY